MSMTTPPGWYADQGVPGTERWWDGTAWTAHTRPLGGTIPPAPYQQPLSYQQGYQQAYQQPQMAPLAPNGGTGGGRGGRARVAVAVAAGLVVAAILAGATLLGDDGTKAAPRSAPTTGETAAGPTAGTGESPTAEPSPDPDVLVDQLNGITLPIPDDWEKSDSFVDRSVTMTTVDDYECPGQTNRYCRYGRVMSFTATQTDADSPEALAKEDIQEASDALYDEDSIGNPLYGNVTSHTVVKSEAVSVTGRTGYLVRWKVTTGKGPGGYVQSLAFPSAIGAGSLVIVRFAFDAGPEGPPLGGMDTITKGIRTIGDSTGGVGSSIAPS
ncbi:DUF2510 domain-containing protein [Streptomyces sp. NPDC051217]|uniref:DUF2510 domain-containing protein n=1 Tax=Streptomyces sp. NPDC051217 TaxID=3365644 RepID=UPI00379DF38D